MHNGHQLPSDAAPSSTADLSAISELTTQAVTQGADAEDKRRDPRITVCSPATIRGLDAQGQQFEEATEVENLTPRGLYLKTQHSPAVGQPLFVMFQLLQERPSLEQSDLAMPAPRIAVRGRVHRVEPKMDANGVAVVFQQYRFL